MAKRSGGKFPGGMNMQNMMKQAQKMQQDMQEKQQQLNEMELEAQAGGGAVKVIVTGARKLKHITIQPEAVDPDDVEMLEDLVIAAVNEAMNMAEEKANEVMGDVTGGMNLGGLF